MADKIFHTWFVEKVAPVWADKIMLSDSEATNQTKFTDIANLPVSTPTSTAIWVVQSDINAHEARTDNPHSVTKAQVGLSDVDNTSDADKPISTATQTALDWKQDTLTGLTATPTELNILDGATLSTTELNYVDGVTSNIQTQLDTKSSLTQIQDNTKQDLSLALTPNYDAINGAIVLDSSKNHYHGTVSGATYVPNGWLNGWWAYGFDGVDDYIELNDGMVIKSLNVTSKDNSPVAVYARDNGIDIYVLWRASDKILRYQMSVVDDISTATYHSEFSVTSQETNPQGLSFSSDGTKVYITGGTWQDITYYSLSVAWDITTATHTSQFSVSAQDTNPRGIYVRPDGTKFYIVWGTNKFIYQYSMSVAWDMSTASYDSISFSVATIDTVATWISFTPDGTQMYIDGQSTRSVNTLSLSTAWDVSTATTTSIKLYISNDSWVWWVYFSSDGTKLYVAGDTTDTIYQYNLYTPYSFSNPIYSNGFTIIADINPDIASWRIIDKTYANNSAVTGHQAYVSASWAVDYRVNAGWVISSGTGKFPLATMKRLVITVSSLGAGIIYSNGVSVASWTTGLPSTLTVSTKTRLWNGSLRTDSPYGWYIGNVRIFSRVLTATEIANDYLQRTEIDNPPEVPRLTTAMRDVMTPELWQPIYNTTTNKSQVYNGTWNDLY